MSLFQRIKTPFGELAEDDSDQPQRRAHAVGALLRAAPRGTGPRSRRRSARRCASSRSYLAALEQGRPQDLPGPTYAIGFVRAYAALPRLRQRPGARRLQGRSRPMCTPSPDLSLPVPLGARSLPGGPILLVGLILALCGYGTWYYLSTGERDRPGAGRRGAGGAAAAGAAWRRGREPATQRPGRRMPLPPPPARGAAPGSAWHPPDQPPHPGRAAAGHCRQPGSGCPAGAPAAATSPAANPPGGDAAPSQPPSGVVASAVAGRRCRQGVGNTAAKPPSDAAGKPAGRSRSARSPIAGSRCAAADQSIVFSRVLKAGETYQVPRAGLILRTGNAGALAIAGRRQAGAGDRRDRHAAPQRRARARGAARRHRGQGLRAPTRAVFFPSPKRSICRRRRLSARVDDERPAVSRHPPPRHAARSMSARCRSAATRRSRCSR